MKTLNEILFINETITTDGASVWSISFLAPECQGGASVEISEEDAKKIMKLLN